MALTATVTKVGVVSSDVGYYTITLNLKVNDGVSDVIDKDFSVNYRTSWDNVSDLEELMRIQMQKEIDTYKAADTISQSSALSTSVTNVQGSLVL